MIWFFFFFLFRFRFLFSFFFLFKNSTDLPFLYAMAVVCVALYLVSLKIVFRLFSLFLFTSLLPSLLCVYGCRASVDNTVWNARKHVIQRYSLRTGKRQTISAHTIYSVYELEIRQERSISKTEEKLRKKKGKKQHWSEYAMYTKSKQW